MNDEINITVGSVLRLNHTGILVVVTDIPNDNEVTFNGINIDGSKESFTRDLTEIYSFYSAFYTPCD